MATPAELPLLDEQVLTDWVVGQRWFGAKARDISQVGVLTAVALSGAEPPLLALTLVQARFGAGTHELYQVLLGGRPAAEGWETGVIGQAGDWTLYDALADPLESAMMMRLLTGGGEVAGEAGTVRFHWTGTDEPPGDEPAVRMMGAEQSNSSVVFDERVVLKAFRRVEPGRHPELEMLSFLTRREFPNIAPLAGWYELSGELMEATLGVAQRYVPDGRDGWELTLERIDDPALLDDLRELGAVTGRMHFTLGTEGADPDFVPEEPTEENLALLVATIDEQIERTFVDLSSDDPALEPISGRGEEVRDRLRLLSHVGAAGRLIRNHGDFHLGQTLLAGRHWLILDFEGEPARPLLERRRKRSALRDVAGMLRSFAYAASATELQLGRPAPEDWERRAREAFLEGYLEAVDPALLPAGEPAIHRLLSIFELEKAVYELRYELNNRPDWVGIPVAGIVRLLEEELPA